MEPDDGYATMTEDLIATQLESLHAAVARVEIKLDKEISELKSEQIADLRKQNERIADDQRRLWDRVGKLESERIPQIEAAQREHQGGIRVGQAILTVVGSLLSGGLVAVAVHFAH